MKLKNIVKVALLLIFVGQFVGQSLPKNQVKWPSAEWVVTPPKGFIKAPEINGFKLESNNDYTMRLMEMPISMQSFADDMVKDSKSRGAEIEELKSFTLDGKQARLFLVKSQNPANPKEIAFSVALLVGNESELTAFIGAAPGDQTDLKDQLIESLKSIKPFKASEPSLTDAELLELTKRLGYTIDVKPLVFADALIGILSFSETGLLPREGDPGGAYLSIVKSSQEIDKEKRGLYAKLKLLESGEDFEITKVDTLPYEAYRVIKEEGTKKTLKVVVFSETGIFRISATAYKDHDQWFKKFEQYLTSFRVEK